MIPGAIHPMTQEIEDVIGSFAQLPPEELERYTREADDELQGYLSIQD